MAAPDPLDKRRVRRPFLINENHVSTSVSRLNPLSRPSLPPYKERNNRPGVEISPLAAARKLHMDAGALASLWCTCENEIRSFPDSSVLLDCFQDRVIENNQTAMRYQI